MANAEDGSPETAHLLPQRAMRTLHAPVRYVTPKRFTTCTLPDGRTVTVPLVVGILKHPAEDELPEILSRPDALRKYTVEALRRAPWQVLSKFPADWLLECLDDAALRPGRRAALLFLLAPHTVGKEQAEGSDLQSSRS